MLQERSLKSEGAGGLELRSEYLEKEYIYLHCKVTFGFKYILVTQRNRALKCPDRTWALSLLRVSKQLDICPISFFVILADTAQKILDIYAGSNEPLLPKYQYLRPFLVILCDLSHMTRPRSCSR